MYPTERIAPLKNRAADNKASVLNGDLAIKYRNGLNTHSFYYLLLHAQHTQFHDTPLLTRTTNGALCFLKLTICALAFITKFCCIWT